MNTIYIEKSAYSYLREWADKDRLKCSLAEPFFKKCEIRKKDNPEYVLYVESKGLERKFSLKINKKLFAKGEFFPTPEGVNDFQVHYKVAEEAEMSQEQLNLMMILITSYVHTNAFLWYGNYLDRDKREFSAVGKIKKATKQSYSDRFKINSMQPQSVITEALRACSKFADTSADIKPARSFG